MSHDYGAKCLCSKIHQPAPLELARHHLLPQEHGGPDTKNNLIWLCPTTHVNVHEILRKLLLSDELMSYHEVNLFHSTPLSRYAYAVATEGWSRIQGKPWKSVPEPAWVVLERLAHHVPGQLEIQS